MVKTAVNHPVGALIADLIARGALFVVNHSGGKDSQATLLAIRAQVPARQILVIHAHLPEVEWPGTVEHVVNDADGLPVLVCQAASTFFETVDRRGMFPSPQQRQCTSDLKRTPIEREIRRYLKLHPEFGGLVVNVMGLRAGESSSRAKRPVFKKTARNSKAGREWYDWLPVHGLHTLQVLGAIAEAGRDLHWAYQEGMTRLSCCFCIMASEADLRTAARLQPHLYQRYVRTERRLGHTMSMAKRPLDTVAGVAVAPERQTA